MVPTLGARLRTQVSNRLFIVALVGGITTLAGCASAGATKDWGASHPELSGLIVRNNNWNSMTVDVVQDGERRRVGDVEGFSVAVFPARQLGFLGSPGGTFLVARPLAGGAFRSEPLVFSPGRTLIWTIENQPAHSYLSVR